MEEGTPNQEIQSSNCELRFCFDGSVFERAGSPEQVKQEGLYLVVRVVGQQERGSREVLGCPGKKLESCFACGGFE